MKKLIWILAVVVALASWALAQSKPGDPKRFIRTYPPSDQEQTGVGSSGPFPDQNALHYVTPTAIANCNGGIPPLQKINNNGDIVGWCFDGADAEAGIYRSGAWVRVGHPTPAGWLLTALLGISPSGAATGYGFVDPGGPTNTWASLHLVAGAGAVTMDGGPGIGVGNIPPDSFSYGINDALNRVGCLNRFDDAYPDPHRAFFFVHGSSTLDELTDEIEASILGPYYDEAVFDLACLQDINASNHAAGWVATSSINRAIYYERSPETITVLGGVPAASYPNMWTARAISETDIVVGEGQLNSGWGGSYPLKWQGGTFTDIGVKSFVANNGDTVTSAQANDVNAAGDSCGVMLLQPTYGEHAFLALADGTVYDLNALIGIGTTVLESCHGINDSRTMVARGHDSGTPATTRYYVVTVSVN